MRKRFFLFSAIAGSVIPWWFFGNFVAVEGLDIPFFVSELFANNPAAGLTSDILISAVVFWVWSYQDAQQHQVKRWWLLVPSTLAVGLSLALPLYLYLREDATETAAV